MSPIDLFKAGLVFGVSIYVFVRGNNRRYIEDNLNKKIIEELRVYRILM